MSPLPPVTDRNEDGSPAPFFTEGEPCENCGRACDAGTRIWIPGWNYYGCDSCASEAAIAIFAEENCPTLYAAFQRSKSVSEVQAAFSEHRRSCPACRKVERKIAQMEVEYRQERAA